MSSAKLSERSRVTSLARSINWSYWWRRLISWLALDVLLLVLALGLFVIASWSPAYGLPYDEGSISSFAIEGQGFDLDSVKLVATINGETRRYPMGPTMRRLAPYAAVLLAWETLDLLVLLASTRRVRRKLQPLNELALSAEEIGRIGLDTSGKIESLEQAIERANIDSPTVTTGDQDLQSIEVALNGLLRRMQEARVQQMRFVSDASHELRTPIAVIQGYVNMLDRWGTSDEQVLNESIEALKAESEHMQELVEQLLFLARGDSGRNQLRLVEVNVADMMREVWEESSMIDEHHEYACAVDEHDASDPRYIVSADLAMLKQAVRVLVQNAQRYSPEASTIRLSAARTSNEVSLTVQDEGIGMSAEDAQHIFNRFWRADAARQESTDGSGLGLSIAKWIIDAHSGTIEVLSSEGVGTRFTVHLPR